MLRRRRRSFWFVLLGTTAFLTIDPALFLVVVALALSGVAVLWTLMLVRGLWAEAFSAGQVDGVTESVCPLRAWRGDPVHLSSSAPPTPLDLGASS
ncbi:MAG: hypothetical protein ACRDL7_15320 [Gaiellaceae bacterium]